MSELGMHASGKKNSWVLDSTNYEHGEVIKLLTKEFEIIYSEDVET